jgi:hypothetical protein
MVFPLISGCNEFIFTSHMTTRLHRFLLLFVVLAVAIAPLRGAIASLSMDADDMQSHCAGMHDSEQASGHMAGMHEPAADKSGHNHQQGCGGDCCDVTCNACAHGLIAMAEPITFTTYTHHGPLIKTASRGFTGRTVHPPFRPPISLRG